MIYQTRNNKQREAEQQQEHWNEVHANLLEVQKKSLEISNPGDADEVEADAVARKIVNGESAEIHGTGGTINRKGEGATEASAEFQTKLESNKGNGQPLDESTRSEMEVKTGADFSGVKIHTGNEAHTMSESINAKAFTHGQDVFFKQGEFNTQSNQGKELLAHELTHTVQQGKGKIQPKIQRQGDDKKTMERLLEDTAMNSMLLTDNPSVTDMETLLNSEVGRRLLLDFNIPVAPDARKISLGDKLTKTGDYEKLIYYTHANRIATDTGLRDPEAKRKAYHKAIRKTYKIREWSKKIAEFDQLFDADIEAIKQELNYKFLTWNKHQAAAIAFSVAMLEQRAHYIHDNQVYVEASVGNLGQTTWLKANDIKAAYTQGTLNDVTLFNLVAWNPDMPLNAKANLLAFVRGGQAYQFDAKHEDPYALGADDVDRDAKYDAFTDDPDFQAQKTLLTDMGARDQLRAALDVRAEKVFAIFKPDEPRMPEQYLSAIGEGGTTRALGGDVIIDQNDLNPQGVDDGKSNVGSGYFMYDEGKDEDNKISGKQNNFSIEFPLTMAEDLEIFMFPYGIDTPVNVPPPMATNKNDLEQWRLVRVTLTIQMASGPVSVSIYFDDGHPGGEVGIYDPLRQTADTQTPLNTILPGVKYGQNTLIIPKNNLYLGKVIDINIEKTANYYRNKRQDEVQVHISTNSKVEEFKEKEKEIKFDTPKVANADSIFKSGSFFIEMEKLADPENKEVYLQIQELAASIKDQDFTDILTGKLTNLDTIFNLTGGGVNPNIKKGMDRDTKPEDLQNLPPLSDKEINELENVKGGKGPLVKKLNKILGGTDYTEDELSQWRSVSGSKRFTDPVEDPKTYKYKTQTELDQINKDYEDKLNKLHYVIDIFGYTDPQGTGENSGPLNDFEDYFLDYTTGSRPLAKDYKSVKPKDKAHKEEFNSNMNILMPDGTDSRHNNNALSTLRALAFLKLLLIEKAKQMDKERGDNKPTSLIALRTRFPNLTVSVTVDRIQEDNTAKKLTFHMDTVPSPIEK